MQTTNPWSLWSCSLPQRGDLMKVLSTRMVGLVTAMGRVVAVVGGSAAVGAAVRGAVAGVVTGRGGAPWAAEVEGLAALGLVALGLAALGLVAEAAGLIAEMPAAAAAKI